MTGGDVLDISKDVLWILMRMGGPLLLTALCTGLVISCFQALMQLQEMSLSFIPKIIAVFCVFFWSLPHMSHLMERLTHDIFSHIQRLEENS